MVNSLLANHIASRMGEVVAAHDQRLEREVAIKRMRDAHPDKESIARFVREAKIQSDAAQSSRAALIKASEAFKGILRKAAAEGREVWLEIVGPQGTPRLRRVRPLRVDAGRVRAVDTERDAELTVAVHRIAGVTLIRNGEAAR